MYIIAGLGNPERKYDGTRHNVGFAVVDILAKEYGIDLTEKEFKAIYGKEGSERKRSFSQNH